MATDNEGMSSDAVTKSTLTIYSPPYISVFPPTGSSNAGQSQNFTVVYSDANGTGDMNGVYIGLRADLTALADAIIAVYEPQTNNLWLYNDPVNQALGPCTPGSQNTISNSQGSLNCAQTTVSYNGNNLTVNWNITPSPTFGGTKNIYLMATDNEGMSSDAITRSTWTIQ